MKVKMNKTLQARLDAAKQRDEFWVDSAKLDFAIALEGWRKQAGKSYKDMAASMKISPAYISKVFRGDANLTIESMVKLARVLNCHLDIRLNLKNKDEESLSLIFESRIISPKGSSNIVHIFDKGTDAQMGRFLYPEYQVACNDTDTKAYAA